jgi:hypothetical protein
MLTACSKLVDNLGQAVQTQLVDRFATRCEIFTCVHAQKRTSCYKSANKLLQICSQAVDKLCSHCLFPVIVTSLEQAVNNL